MKLLTNIRYILGIPKSIYVNFKLLPFSQAIRLPIIVSHKTKCTSLKGKVVLRKIKPGIVRIGFGSIKLIDFSYERTILHIDGTVEFNGKCKIGRASRIEVTSNGHLSFGDRFIVSGGCKIICAHRIKLGANSLYGWETLIMDTDYHKIYNNHGNRINEDRPIELEDKVWLGARAVVLKGSKISSGSIVAAGSIVAGQYLTPNVLLAGNPAKIVKTDISWEE